MAVDGNHKHRHPHGKSVQSQITSAPDNVVIDSHAQVIANLNSRHVLQRTRQRSGFQQSQLAQIVSVHWTDIQHLENGNKAVSLLVLEKVSRALDIHLDYVVVGS